MDALRRAIEQDLRQFDADRPFAVTPPDLARYDEAGASADAIDGVIRWLGSADATNSAPPGYVEYVVLYLQAKAAEMRFRARAQANLCTVCFDDIGPGNPRQLCRKQSCWFQ